jgi:hypothetical protein
LLWFGHVEARDQQAPLQGWQWALMLSTLKFTPAAINTARIHSR